MIKQLCISYKGLTYFSADILIVVGYADGNFSIVIFSAAAIRIGYEEHMPGQVRDFFHLKLQHS